MRADIERRLKALELDARARAATTDALSRIDVTEHEAPIYRAVHDAIEARTYRYINLPGGRGSAKSSFAALELVNGVMADPTGQTSAIAFRRYASTMRESIFSTIQWAIDVLDVNDLWRATLAPMGFCYLPTGAVILCRGLDDASKLKSIKPLKGVFRLGWFEEFSELPGENFTRNVMQSIMRGGEGFTAIRTFNPPNSRSSWVNLLVERADPRALTLRTTFRDVPREWLGPDFILEAERLKEINPTAYENEYEGLACGDGSEVFGDNLLVREITDDELQHLDYIHAGLDFGFSIDPACYLRVSYDRKHDTVYLLDEIYGRGISNKAMADEIKARGYDQTPDYSYSMFGGAYRQKETITADSSEPKSIADLQGEGLKVIPCQKWPGCVQYRIKWLQHRRIVCDPRRTPNAHRELSQYEYKRSKDGELLADLPDANNHSIDALAYALDREIYRKGVPA